MRANCQRPRGHVFSREEVVEEAVRANDGFHLEFLHEILPKPSNLGQKSFQSLQIWDSILDQTNKARVYAANSFNGADY